MTKLSCCVLLCTPTVLKKQAHNQSNLDSFKKNSLDTNYSQIIAQTATDKGFDGSEFRSQSTSIEPVPKHLSLAKNRYYIWLTIDFERWAIPIQLTEKEARSLLPEVAEVRDRSQALNIVEGFCQRRSGVQS